MLKKHPSRHNSTRVFLMGVLMAAAARAATGRAAMMGTRTVAERSTIGGRKRTRSGGQCSGKEVNGVAFQPAFPVRFMTAGGQGSALVAAAAAAPRHSNGLAARRRHPLFGNRGQRLLGVRYLNRIMIEREEVQQVPRATMGGSGEEGGASDAFVVLSGLDPRTKHVRSILKANSGDSVRCGVLDGGTLDDAGVQWVSPPGREGGSPEGDVNMLPGSSLGDLASLPPGLKLPSKVLPAHNVPKNRSKAAKRNAEEVLVLQLRRHAEELLASVPVDSRPKVDLMLAVPRPLQLERLLPMISSLGVGTLVLCNAAKVEKAYFGSHLFREPSAIRLGLAEGLAQCGDTALPRTVVAKRLKVFLQDSLDTLFPPEKYMKLIAHPTRWDSKVPPPRVRSALPPPGVAASDVRILLAIGPEGGWDDPFELDLFQAHGFQTVTWGPRVLRSDVAVCALLSQAHDLLDSLEQPQQHQQQP